MRPPEKNQRGRWNQPDKEWLEYYYITLGKTMRQIAREVHVKWRTVGNWLENANIEVRLQGWKGGRSHGYWRRKARKSIRETEIPEQCDRCEVTQDLCVHHKDRDIRNSEPKNLRWLCKSCHKKLHWEQDKQIITFLQSNEWFRKLVRGHGINPDYFWGDNREFWEEMYDLAQRK